VNFVQRLDCERDSLAELSRLPLDVRKNAIDLIDHIILFDPRDATHAYAMAEDNAPALEISTDGLALARSLIHRAA
jgi:hypothetical protein